MRQARSEETSPGTGQASARHSSAHPTPDMAQIEDHPPEQQPVDGHAPVHDVVDRDTEHGVEMDARHQPEVDDGDEQKSRDKRLLNHPEWPTDQRTTYERIDQVVSGWPWADRLPELVPVRTPQSGTAQGDAAPDAESGG